jgi:hypothetical protein
MRLEYAINIAILIIPFTPDSFRNQLALCTSS